MMGLLLCFWDRILATSCLQTASRDSSSRECCPRTSLFQGGSLFKTSGSCLSQSTSVRHSNDCPLHLNCLSEGCRSVWLQLIRGECISPCFLEVVFSPGCTDTCLQVIQSEPKSAIQEMSLTKITQWQTHPSRISYVTPLFS